MSIPDNKMVSRNRQTELRFTARKLVLLSFSFLFLQQSVFLFSTDRQFALQDAPMLPTVIEFQAQGKMSHPLKNVSDAKKVLRVLQAEKVLIHLFQKFQQNGAPIALGFGTALHAFRKGPFFRPNFEDDDIDLMVFPHHFLSMFDNEMDRELQDLFGWAIWRPEAKEKRKEILQIGPKEDGPYVNKTSFQIDVYAMHCDLVRGTISEPWDGFEFKLNDFLPFRKEMWDLSHMNENGSFYYRLPNQNECFLDNFYGEDFRVPQKKKRTKPRKPPKRGIFLYADKPRCEERVLDLSEQQEFMEQLLFCQGREASQENIEALQQSMLNGTVRKNWNTIQEQASSSSEDSD
jgi:hypothetical protein